MICELSDGDRAPLRRQVPKYAKLAMYEGKYGFFLQPVCVITSQKVEINRIRIPVKKAHAVGELVWWQGNMAGAGVGIR